MSAPDRRAMLDRADRTLSLRRPMRASWRGALGRLPAAQSGPRQRRCADAPDRRTVHRLAVSRLAPDDGDAARGGRVCEPEARPAADASDGDRSARAEAENEQARARPQDLSLSPAQSDDRAREPRLGCRHQCAAASGVRDGGRSPAIGLQEQVANHRKRLWSKAGVVSVTEKALQRRQVGDRKANTREPPFKCRKCSDDVETGE